MTQLAINLTEIDLDNEKSTVGTVLSGDRLVERITAALELHFSGVVKSIEKVSENFITDVMRMLTVEITVMVEIDGDIRQHTVEASQTWLF